MKKGMKICTLLLIWTLCVSGCGKANPAEEGSDSAQTPVPAADMDDADDAEEARTAEGVSEPEDMEAGRQEILEEVQQETEEDSEPAEDTLSPLHVEGARLVDESGSPVQLRGISTHGLAWYPAYVNEACFRELKEEWGMDVVRLAMYTAESGGYCTDGDREALKALVRQGVEYATDCGLYVVIDWHILSDGNPNTYIEEAKEFFDEMSGAYAEHTNVIYEICNEPNGGTSWSQIKSYAEQIIPVIRQKDEDGIILVGTPNWSQYVDQAAADPITGYDNIMYTLHFYAATHTDSLRNALVEAAAAGLPVFVSEYGICDASGNGAIDTVQANQWVETMDELGVSYVAWNLSNKAETSAILKSSCGKTAEFTEEDLSDSGRWLLEMLGAEGSQGQSRNAAGEGPQEGQSSAKGADGAQTGAPQNVPAEADRETSTGPSGNGQAQQDKGQTGSGRTETDQERQASGELEVSASMVNTWEQGEETYCQYDLTITNQGKTRQDGWTVCLVFDSDIALQDSWNGNYQAEGNALTISSMDYNNIIESGGSVENVGFIVKGAGPLVASYDIQ